MALTFDAKTNFAYSVIATAPAPAASGTSLVVAPGDGAKFPAAPFNVVVWPTGVQPTTANAEVIRVTAKATDTFTITRAQESSVARTILVNDQIALNVTAKSFTDLQTAFTTASVLTAPIGSAIMWFTDTAPTGWLLLRGQAVSRATYATLFALWGTTYGAGDGATTFNVPDLQSRLPIGKGLAGTLATLGATAGSWDHTHGPGTLQVENHSHGPGTYAAGSHSHDPGTLQVAAHTHGPGTLTVASHSHTAGTLAAASENIDHTHSLSDHTHTFSDVSNGPSSFTGAIQTGSDFTAAHADHTHDVSGTTSGPSPNATGTMSSNTTHSHGISGDTGSLAPALGGGVTGSTAPMVTGGATATATAAVTGLAGNANPNVTVGVTGTGNPPVLVVNFIVRATNEV